MGRAAIEGWLTLDAAKKLVAMAGQDLGALKKQALSREFRPVPLGLDASMAVKNTLRTLDSQNVLAKLPGSDPRLADEYVVYTAHWDHLGVGATIDGDNIYNGALDNASGCASVLEIAKAFKQIEPPPKRSILFLLVTAEEQGLLGSQHYSLNPVYPLAKTLANINLDTINQWGRTKDITVKGLGASELDDYLRDAAAEQGRTLRPDPEPEKGEYYRSDHFNFAKQGVPALYTAMGVDFAGKPPEYSRQKRDEYLEPRLPRAVRRGEAGLGPRRRRRRRPAAARRRLPGGPGRPVSRVAAGQRVQSETRRFAEGALDAVH